MLVAVRGLCGVGRIPHHRISAEQCILRFGARIHQLKGAGGTFHAVALSDLPEPERLACLRRQIENLHLDPGTYDDAAHADFVQAAPSRRERAERKAAIARLLVSLGPDVGWADRLRLVRGQFGDKGTSKPRLQALLTAVKGVDPINYAPALLDHYKGKTEKAGISPDAWRFFLTTIRDAAPEFPLIQAWRDTRDVGKKRGWAVPSYPTFYRRWQDLSAAPRSAARPGSGGQATDATRRARQDQHQRSGITSLLAVIARGLDPGETSPADRLSETLRKLKPVEREDRE